MAWSAPGSSPFSESLQVSQVPLFPCRSASEAWWQPSVLTAKDPRLLGHDLEHLALHGEGYAPTGEELTIRVQQEDGGGDEQHADQRTGQRVGYRTSSCLRRHQCGGGNAGANDDAGAGHDNGGGGGIGAPSQESAQSDPTLGSLPAQGSECDRQRHGSRTTVTANIT